MRFPRILSAVVLVLLSGCASLPQNNNDDSAPLADAVIDVAPDQLAEAPDVDQAELPNMELDAELLDQLLSMNIASYAGKWQVASDNALAAALRSKDPRLAEAATMTALRARDYASAIQASGLWSTLEPDSENASNMFFLSLVGGDDTESAKAFISDLDQSADAAIRRISGLLVRQSNSVSALEISKYLTEHYVDSAQAFVSAAYVAEHFQKFDIAEPWVAKALELNPGWDLAGQMRARLLNTQGKVEERTAFIESFVSQYPESVAMRINWAAELTRQQKYTEAKAVIDGVLETEPRDTSALQYAGALAEQEKDHKTAAKYYRKALMIDNSNDDLRWSLARLAVRDKRYAIAERYFSEITDPNLLVNAQIQVANMRMETQGIEIALNTLRLIEPRTREDFINVALNRHYLLMEEYMYDEAFAYVNQTLIYLPENLELLYARSLVAAELRNLKVAEGDLRSIIAKEPDNANALNALGYTLADQTNRYEEARELIAQALEINPDQSHILDSMGWVLYRLNRLEESIEYLEKALAAEYNPEIAAHLGEVYWQNGNQQRAREVWNESLEKDPDHPVLLETIERFEGQSAAQES